MSKTISIGFPAPLLGRASLRLPVLFDDGERIVLAKPAGILVQQDPWYPRLPMLVEAIRYQAANGKPELAKLGINEGGLWAVNDLDPNCHGPVLFTRTREVGEHLRSQIGSGLFSFRFDFLSSASSSGKTSMDCELPLARHGRLPRMLVSHTTGKKAKTTFNYDKPVGAYSCWQASTNFARRHQVLLHALETGLPVLGDRTYARSEPLFLSHLKPSYHLRKDRDELPLFDGPAYFLAEISGPEGWAVLSPPPSRWGGLVNQLVKHTHPR